MKKLLEPYAKENNLLQLPLFCFSGHRGESSFVQWKDTETIYSLKCDCSYSIPGAFEQDVYTATMRIWLKQGMPKEIKLNYSDVARELNLQPAKNFVSQIRKSMKRLAHARYEFVQCFLYVGNDPSHPIRVDTHFSLYSSASLFSFNKDAKEGDASRCKKMSESRIIFPDEIRNNLEKRYYQLLDLAWYRNLPVGLPRRLYEYLEKRRYHGINDVFSVSENLLARWLPIVNRNAFQRRKTIEKSAQALINAGYLKEYKLDPKSKICSFFYAKPLGQSSEVDQPETKEDNPELHILRDWLESIPYFHKGRMEEILAMPNSMALFPGIKAEYEKQKNHGKIPKVGWIYKAFKDRWNFHASAENERQLSEKKHKQAVMEAFKEMPEARRQEIRRKFEQAYSEYPEMQENGYIWMKFIEGSI